MIRFHDEHAAHITVAAMVVDPRECRQFGMIHTDDSHRIVRFEEKPARTESRLASMGVYLFDREALKAELESIVKPKKGFDFGKDVLPHALERYRAVAYPFEGYWRDVGTIKAYFDAHMDLLDPESGLELEAWRVYTNPEDRGLQDRPPARLLSGAEVASSLLSRGCVVNGLVERAILSPGVVVEEGAIVRDSIVLHDTRIETAAVIAHCIVDKDVTIGRGARVGHGRRAPPNRLFPTHLDCGITVVGKGAVVPPKTFVGRNCIVRPGARAVDFPGPRVASGETVGPE
jgi:glucose-1-phosphate adenylyltransferase